MRSQRGEHHSHLVGSTGRGGSVPCRCPPLPLSRSDRFSPPTSVAPFTQIRRRLVGRGSSRLAPRPGKHAHARIGSWLRGPGWTPRRPQPREQGCFLMPQDSSGLRSSCPSVQAPLLSRPCGRRGPADGGGRRAEDPVERQTRPGGSTGRGRRGWTARHGTRRTRRAEGRGPPGVPGQSRQPHLH